MVNLLRKIRKKEEGLIIDKVTVITKHYSFEDNEIDHDIAKVLITKDGLEVLDFKNNAFFAPNNLENHRFEIIIKSIFYDPEPEVEFPIPETLEWKGGDIDSTEKDMSWKDGDKDITDFV